MWQLTQVHGEGFAVTLFSGPAAASSWLPVSANLTPRFFHVGASCLPLVDADEVSAEMFGRN